MQEKESLFISANEVSGLLGVSIPYAYKLLRDLNEELRSRGFWTISGRTSRQYFYEKIYGMDKAGDNDARV